MTKFAGTSFTRESDGADAFEGGGAGGTTNLSILNRNATTLDIASSSGADATVPAATALLAGVMTATDKAKLDGIGSGANVASVAGKTGAVALAPADIVGLGEFIDDEVASLLVAGANITLTYDYAANTLTISSTGGGGGGLTNNWTATSAPTASNDGTQGYAVGSQWLWAAIGAEWVCTSAATGAAVWVPKTTASAIAPSTGTRWTSLLEGPVTLAASSSTSANRLSLAPFRNYRRRSISELGARVTTGVASSNIALAIYAHDPATGFPTGSALCSTGSISSAAAGAVSSTISGGGSITLEPGVYWMAIWASAANIQYQHTSMNSAAIMQAAISGDATLANVILGNTSAGCEVTCSTQPTYNPASWPTFPATTLINNGFQNYVPFLYAKGV